MFGNRWQMSRRILPIILLLGMVASSWAQNAPTPSRTSLMGPLAYIDPGSGQFVWQMVVGGCIGALFYVKRIRTFIVCTIKKWFGKD